MAGMMPEEMIRPASGFAFRVHVRPSKEEGLHDQVLQLELTLLDAFVNPLMAWIERGCGPPWPSVRFPSAREDLFGVCQESAMGISIWTCFAGAHD
jgi:hypothetical protein